MVIVQVDLRLDVTALFPRVQEQLGELHPEGHVVRTAAPLPPAGLFRLQLLQAVVHQDRVLVDGVQKAQLFLLQAFPQRLGHALPVDGRIAAAADQATLGASSGHTVRHPGGGDRVRERTLAVSCGRVQD